MRARGRPETETEEEIFIFSSAKVTDPVVTAAITLNDIAICTLEFCSVFFQRLEIWVVFFLHAR